jgi:myo-inositol-1(or 4)-monophosphatase
MGEESGLSDRQTEAIWVVDPIDGTTNFSRGLPFFSVSIALLHGSEVKIGVIFNPTTDELFFAERGQGAYLNGDAIHVSTYRDPARAVICLDRGYAKADVERMVTILSRLDRKYNVRVFGTSAFELTTLARGATDAFICSGDELWDYVAGVLLVQEAGGKFTDWRGEPWNRHHSFVFASNGALHDLLLPEISDLQA